LPSASGAAHHDHRENREGHAQHQQRQRQPPIQHQRGRQQHDDEHESREVLAEELHPQPPERIGAGEHDLELPARMRAGVIGER
jgi:hypothetical protein